VPELLIRDSGLLDGAANDAADRAALAHHAGAAELRFWRVTPTASVGAFQALDRELRLDFCREQGIAVVRRASGGGALYLDPDQLGFTLVATRDDTFAGAGLDAIYRRFGAALVRGLERLGIAANFKAPNDIEIEGRKLASFFAAARGPALLIHGSLLLDADIRNMLIALRVPTEKLSADGLAAARDRLVTVRERLGAIPDLATVQGGLAGAIAAELGLTPRAASRPLTFAGDEAGFARIIDWSDTEGWLEAVYKCDGGTLRARARFGEDDSRIEAVELAGDVHVIPADTLLRLGEALNGAEARGICAIVDALFAAGRPGHGQVEALGFGAADLMRLLQILLEKQRLRLDIGLDLEDASALMVVGGDGISPQDILDHASVMLVPYCAKPSWCKWRFEDGCTECGLCEVGDAYRLARERGMKVTSIVRYEHLVDTLRQMRAAGEPAYVGMCCSNFFIKRQRAFRDAGIPALLMDISGANCYELQQEDQAYAGRFEAKAELDSRLLEQVMRFVPPRGDEGR
jgi:lipoate-protein ligase A